MVRRPPIATLTDTLFPYTTLFRSVHGDHIDWQAIDRLHAEWRPDGLVVGDPMTLDGGDQPVRERAHAFARELQARYALPVVLMDERSSSIEAAQRFALARAPGRSSEASRVGTEFVSTCRSRWSPSPLKNK